MFCARVATTVHLSVPPSLGLSHVSYMVAASTRHYLQQREPLLRLVSLSYHGPHQDMAHLGWQLDMGGNSTFGEKQQRHFEASVLDFLLRNATSVQPTAVVVSRKVTRLHHVGLMTAILGSTRGMHRHDPSVFQESIVDAFRATPNTFMETLMKKDAAFQTVHNMEAIPLDPLTLVETTPEPALANMTGTRPTDWTLQHTSHPNDTYIYTIMMALLSVVLLLTVHVIGREEAKQRARDMEDDWDMVEP